MKRVIASLLVIATVTSSTVTRADEKSVSPPPAVITPLKKGQPAPFPGVLFSQPASAAIVSEINALKDKAKADVDKAVATAIADKQLEIDSLASSCKKDKVDLNAEITGKTNYIVRLEKDLKDSEERAKKLEAEKPSRSTWFTVGLVSGIVATVVTVFAVGQAAK